MLASRIYKMTVLEVLTSASDYLAKRGVENPRLNAEHLLAHVLNKQRLELYLEFDRFLDETERAPLRELIRQRGQRLPLQHLLGTIEFYGRKFLCDSRALIPRPETEQLLELALSQLAVHTSHPLTLLDIGTGSGVIAATLALELPHATVYATDLSLDALALARENLHKYQLTDRIHLQQSDLFPKASCHYAAILANLPYIPSSQITTLSPEVQHDPIQALDGGPEGLDLLQRFIHSAPSHLQPNGTIWLEIGSGQGETLIGLLEKNSFQEIRLLRDYQRIPRFITAKR